MKALSWALSVVLLLGTVALLAFGVRQLTTTSASPAPQAAAPAQTPTPVVADSARLRSEVMTVGSTSAVRLLSYTPQSAERELTAAAEELTTGPFRRKFTRLVTETVIPGATSKQITAEANVPAVAVESLDAGSATVLAFVDQRVTVGAEEPTETASSIRIELTKVDGEWLVAAFDPL